MKIINPDQLTSFELKIPSSGSAFDSERGTFPGSASPSQGPVSQSATESQFEQALKDTIKRVNETQNSADASVARMAAGQEPNIHNTMLELEQADISLRLAMNVRQKMLDAYQEIMRMQV